MSAPADAANAIISAVLFEHGLTEEEFFAPGTVRPDISDARRDAALRLQAAGHSKRAIARALRRDRSSVYRDYLGRDSRYDRKAWRVVEGRLPADTLQVIERCAAVRKTTAYAVMLEWLSDRAMHEVRAA